MCPMCKKDVHLAKDNERPADIAELLNMDVKLIIALNKHRFPKLKQNSRLQAGTILIIRT